MSESLREPGDMAAYVDAFETYAARYADEIQAAAAKGEKTLHGLVLLKRDHSLRVYANAEQIVAAQDFDSVQQRVCLLAALFHDTGRFDQYRSYGTFDDARSLNHGLLGVKSLKRWGVLDREPALVRKTVLTAVGLHNRKKVQPGLPRLADQALRVVRDADKIDILPVIADQLISGDEKDDVVLLHLERDSTKYTSALLDAVIAGRNGDYKAMRYTTDFALLLCSWAFDFNYAASRRMVVERGDMERIFSLLPAIPEMHDVQSRVRAVLAT